MTTPYRYVKGLSPAYRSIRRVLAGRAYAGSDVWCPVCDRGFSAWLGSREHGTCPYCQSECRQRMLALYLGGFLRGRRGLATEVLFFAPDWGMLRWLSRRPGLRLRTTDLSAPGVDFHCDIAAMRQVADASFDLVLCSHVLEHVPDDARAMRELHRVTRPGGTCVVQVPYARGREHTDADPTVTDPADRKRRFGQFDHLRRYGRDIVDRLGEAGFTVSPRPAVTTVAAGSAVEARRFGLWEDTMFVCSRPAGAQVVPFEPRLATPGTAAARAA